MIRPAVASPSCLDRCAAVIVAGFFCVTGGHGATAQASGLPLSGAAAVGISSGPQVAGGIPALAFPAAPRAEGEAGVAATLRAAKRARLQDDGSARLQQNRLTGLKAPAQLDVIVLMCDFADSLLLGRFGQLPGDFPPPRQSEFHYAAHDSVFYDHLFTDMATYFREASGGRFALNFTIHPVIVNLNEPMVFYGDDPDNEEQPIQLAADVIAEVDSAIDFTLYDTVALIHAGAGEESDILNDSPEQISTTYLSPEDFAAAVQEEIWPTAYIAVDDPFGPGRGVDQILILPETEFQDPFAGFSGFSGSLGVYCFEIGLRLGMLSLTDFTPAGRPDSQGIGNFGLMGYGLWVAGGFLPPQPCAFNKLLMGWLDPFIVEPEAGDEHTLTPAADPAIETACARVEISNQEYWLLEYRLQDPDGDGLWTIPGDLNGNGRRDFWDADSENGDGTPTGFFDPSPGSQDEREWLDGTEWDFWMTENTLPGGGSGIYIWHVDEGVIQAVFDAESNLFNADPLHKSVDLEEADGIQDLDSRQGSAYVLGGHTDCFRGEGNATFGPATVPGSESASGAWTGILIDGISAVISGSPVAGDDAEPPMQPLDYAEQMTFRCTRSSAGEGAPQLIASRALDAPEGVDLRGSHLLAADLDESGDGRLEIVATGKRGEVFVLQPDLSEMIDLDADPATVEPLAVGLGRDGAPVAWNGPSAVGRLAAGAGISIVLTGPDGVYAFGADDGTELTDGDGDPTSYGLLRSLVRCSLPPLLLPWGSFTTEESEVVACVVEEGPEGVALRFIDGTGADASSRLNLGNSRVAAPPLYFAPVLAAAATDTVTGESTLHLWRWTQAATVPTLLAEVALAGPPGAQGLSAGRFGQDPFMVVADTAGVVEVLRWENELAGQPQRREAWPGAARAVTPVAPGLAYAGPAGFALVTTAGAPQTGWPVQPRPAVFAPAPELAPSPLSAAMAGKRVFLFQSRDGRLYLYDEAGRLQPGWPMAGPAATSGTPLLLDLDADEQLDLVASGTFDRITGRDLGDDSLLTLPVSRLMRWSGLGEMEAGAGWGMWRGDAWRTGGGAGIAVLPRSGPENLLAESHICYPSPLLSGPLHVRATATSDGQARAYAYNLEGQEVAASEPARVLGGEPFEILLPLEGVSSGLYICRLLYQGNGQDSQTSVVSFAVAR